MCIGSAVGGAGAMILLFAYVAPLCSWRIVVETRCDVGECEGLGGRKSHALSKDKVTA